MIDQKVIFTIGHSNVLANRIIDLLKTYDIRVVVDVRSSPYSQYSPQFNREVFEKTLSEAGFEYKYAGEFLGGRPKDPTCYKNQQIPEGKADYLNLVDYRIVMTKDWFKKGINRLLQISDQNRTVIMCSEEDPAHCHRHHLIGKYLAEQGISILHIRGDGNVVKADQIPGLNNDLPAEQLKLF